jgi:hypothetical protein
VIRVSCMRFAAERFGVIRVWCMRFAVEGLV